MTDTNLTLFRFFIHKRVLCVLLLIFGLHLSNDSYCDPGESSKLPVNLKKDPRFERSRTLAQETLKNFPPDQYVILGLGRTTGLTSYR